MENEDNWLEEYHDAIGKIPARILDQKIRDHGRYMDQYMTPITEQINILKSVQPTKLRKGRNKTMVQEVVWSKEGKQELEKLRKEEKRVYENAEKRFWKGYEHLRPGTQVRKEPVEWIRKEKPQRFQARVWDFFCQVVESLRVIKKRVIDYYDRISF